MDKSVFKEQPGNKITTHRLKIMLITAEIPKQCTRPCKSKQE